MGCITRSTLVFAIATECLCLFVTGRSKPSCVLSHSFALSQTCLSYCTWRFQSFFFFFLSHSLLLLVQRTLISLTLRSLPCLVTVQLKLLLPSPTLFLYFLLCLPHSPLPLFNRTSDLFVAIFLEPTPSTPNKLSIPLYFLLSLSISFTKNRLFKRQIIHVTKWIIPLSNMLLLLWKTARETYNTGCKLLKLAAPKLTQCSGGSV